MFAPLQREWIKLNTGEVIAKELFDHQVDPMETKNVVDDVAYQADVKFLAQKVAERIKATDHDHDFKKIQ